MRKGIGGHTAPVRGANDEWLTPPHVLDALGNFDLDPCAPVQRPWPVAKEHLTINDDGLACCWHWRRVFCNPPYSNVEAWLSRCAVNGNAIALTFARTDTAWFHEQVFEKASAILFLKGRLTFRRADGTPGTSNSGGPSVLVAYDGSMSGKYNRQTLALCGLPGQFVQLNGAHGGL